MNKWLSGTLWVGVATGVGTALHFGLTSDQVNHVSNAGDIIVQILAVASAAAIAFFTAMRGNKN